MIILEILKVIGIFILCLLAVVIFLCLAILFAPIKYELILDTIKDFRYSFFVKWLAGFVQIRKKIFSNEIWLCIAGIEAYKFYGSDGNDDEEEKEESAENQEEEETFDDVIIQMGPMDIDIDQKDIEAEIARREKIKKEKEEEEERKKIEEEKKKLAKEQGENWQPDKAEKEDETIDKIFEIIDYIKEKIQKNKKSKTDKNKNKTKEKMDGNDEGNDDEGKTDIDRKAQIKEILFDMRCQRGLRHALKELKNLLLWLAPYRIDGDVKYGTGDASSTGVVTGIVSLFPFVYQDQLNFYPDFEEKVFMAKCNAFGKIRLFYLLKLLLRIYKDDALMYFIGVAINGVNDEEEKDVEKDVDKGVEKDVNKEG